MKLEVWSKILKVVIVWQLYKPKHKRQLCDPKKILNILNTTVVLTGF